MIRFHRLMSSSAVPSITANGIVPGVPPSRFSHLAEAIRNGISSRRAQDDDEEDKKKDTKSKKSQDDDEDEKKKDSRAQDDDEDEKKKDSKSAEDDEDDKDKEKSKKSKKKSQDEDDDDDKKKSWRNKNDPTCPDSEDAMTAREFERDRIHTILDSKAAKLNPHGALHFALKTDMPASYAIATLEAISYQQQPIEAQPERTTTPALRERMGETQDPNIGAGGVSAGSGDPTSDMAMAIIAADKKRRGEK